MYDFKLHNTSTDSTLWILTRNRLMNISTESYGSDYSIISIIILCIWSFLVITFLSFLFCYFLCSVDTWQFFTILGFLTGPLTCSFSKYLVLNQIPGNMLNMNHEFCICCFLLLAFNNVILMLIKQFVKQRFI